MCGWRVGSCDTVFKVRTGNALRFVGFGFGLMIDKTFGELLFLKELDVDSQGLCEPLKTWGWDDTRWCGTGSALWCFKEQLFTPRLLPGQVVDEDTGHSSTADGQGRGRESPVSSIAYCRFQWSTGGGKYVFWAPHFKWNVEKLAGSSRRASGWSRARSRSP